MYSTILKKESQVAEHELVSMEGFRKLGISFSTVFHLNPFILQDLSVVFNAISHGACLETFKELESTFLQ